MFNSFINLNNDYAKLSLLKCENFAGDDFRDKEEISILLNKFYKHSNSLEYNEKIDLLNSTIIGTSSIKSLKKHGTTFF